MGIVYIQICFWQGFTMRVGWFAWSAAKSFCFVFSTHLFAFGYVSLLGTSSQSADVGKYTGQNVCEDVGRCLSSTLPSLVFLKLKPICRSKYIYRRRYLRVINISHECICNNILHTLRLLLLCRSPTDHFSSRVIRHIPPGCYKYRCIHSMILVFFT